MLGLSALNMIGNISGKVKKKPFIHEKELNCHCGEIIENKHYFPSILLTFNYSTYFSTKTVLCFWMKAFTETFWLLMIAPAILLLLTLWSLCEFNLLACFPVITEDVCDVSGLILYFYLDNADEEKIQFLKNTFSLFLPSTSILKKHFQYWNRLFWK